MMCFHESYGNLPVETLTLIGQYNVSPADYDMMLDLLNPWIDGDDSTPGRPDWQAINVHIIHNSPKGYYQPRFF